MKAGVPLEAEDVAKAVGSAIKALRKQSGITLQTLADRCAVSPPFLSQLENGRAMPSILTLHRVAVGLGTTAQALLAGDDPDVFSIVRADEGAAYPLGDGGVARFLVRGRHSMEPNEMSLDAGFSTEHLSHAGEELIHVIEGRVKIDLAGVRSETLEPGDTFCYPATLEHNISASDDGPAKLLIISSPPSF